MAKHKALKKGHEGRVTQITTPSRFGSHKSMIIEEHILDIQENEVVLQDEFGYYITTKDRLDTGLADPRRTSEKRNIQLEVLPQKGENA